jgi:hypothetical protein
LAGRAGHLKAWEIKSGKTVAADYFKGLTALDRHLGGFKARSIIYGGEKAMTRQETKIIPWKSIPGIFIGKDE